MKKLKKVIVLLLAVTLLAVSLVGCGKRNEPVADLNNWINAIYISDEYTEEMSTTFTVEEFKEAKQVIQDEIEKEFLGDDIDALKEQITSMGVENADQEVEDLMIKLKDGVVPVMFESFKNVEYVVEEVSKDKEKAILKIISAPIDVENTMENVMTLFSEKIPQDIDFASITPENIIDTFDTMLVTPMTSAYQEGFLDPVYLEKQEVLINMEYNAEAKVWEPADADMEKLETIFLV